MRKAVRIDVRACERVSGGAAFRENVGPNGGTFEGLPGKGQTRLPSYSRHDVARMPIPVCLAERRRL